MKQQLTRIYDIIKVFSKKHAIFTSFMLFLMIVMAVFYFIPEINLTSELKSWAILLNNVTTNSGAVISWVCVVMYALMLLKIAKADGKPPGREDSIEESKELGTKMPYIIILLLVAFIFVLVNKLYLSLSWKDFLSLKNKMLICLGISTLAYLFYKVKLPKWEKKPPKQAVTATPDIKGNKSSVTAEHMIPMGKVSVERTSPTNNVSGEKMFVNDTLKPIKKSVDDSKSTAEHRLRENRKSEFSKNLKLAAFYLIPLGITAFFGYNLFSEYKKIAENITDAAGLLKTQYTILLSYVPLLFLLIIFSFLLVYLLIKFVYAIKRVHNSLIKNLGNDEDGSILSELFPNKNEKKFLLCTMLTLLSLSLAMTLTDFNMLSSLILYEKISDNVFFNNLFLLVFLLITLLLFVGVVNYAIDNIERFYSSGKIIADGILAQLMAACKSIIESMPKLPSAFKKIINDSSAIEIFTNEETYWGSLNNQLSVLTSAAFACAVVSFFTTAQGLKKFLFAGNSLVAFTISGAVQSMLFIISIKTINSSSDEKNRLNKTENLPFWKRIAISDILINAFFVVLLLFSSFFSFVFFSDNLFSLTKDGDTNRVLYEEYSKELYDLKAYTEGGIRNLNTQIQSKIATFQRTLSDDKNVFELTEFSKYMQQQKSRFAAGSLGLTPVDEDDGKILSFILEIEKVYGDKYLSDEAGDIYNHFTSRIAENSNLTSNINNLLNEISELENRISEKSEQIISESEKSHAALSRREIDRYEENKDIYIKEKETLEINRETKSKELAEFRKTEKLTRWLDAQVSSDVVNRLNKANKFEAISSMNSFLKLLISNNPAENELSVSMGDMIRSITDMFTDETGTSNITGENLYALKELENISRDYLTLTQINDDIENHIKNMKIMSLSEYYNGEVPSGSDEKKAYYQYAFEQRRKNINELQALINKLPIIADFTTDYNKLEAIRTLNNLERNYLDEITELERAVVLISTSPYKKPFIFAAIVAVFLDLFALFVGTVIDKKKKEVADVFNGTKAKDGDSAEIGEVSMPMGLFGSLNSGKFQPTNDKA